MICPNCGRTISAGEICQCVALDVAHRGEELADESEDRKENARIKYEKKKKEKSEKIQAASQKADEATDSMMNFGKKIFECFKHMDKVDEMYIEKENAKTAAILIGIHTVLNILLVYLAMAKSPLGLSFLAASVFQNRVETALMIGAFTISVLPMIVKIGIMRASTNDKFLLEVSSEYIFTLPTSFLTIIVSLISPGLGLAFMLAIVVFGSLWTCTRLEKNGCKKEKALVITTAAMLIVGIATIIICALIA